MSGMRGRRKRKLNELEISEFFGQIAVMTQAGISLPDALDALQDGDENGRIKQAYKELYRQIHQGISVSDAMEKMGIFPDTAVQMCRAGELGGRLSEAMKKLSFHSRKEYRINCRIREAMVYPRLLVFSAIMLILIVFLIVMPTVEPLFEGNELPALTKGLLRISNFLRFHGGMAVAVLILFIGICKLLGSRPAIRCFRDRIILHLPIIGKQLRIIYTYRFSQSQSMLYASGITLTESLEIAGRIIGNYYLAEQFKRVLQRIQNGEMLSGAVRDVDGLDRKLAAVIFVGEETGKLDVMLSDIAEAYEFESDAAISRLVRLLEPAMILIMGVITGIVLLGIMLPVWSMYNYIQ